MPEPRPGLVAEFEACLEHYLEPLGKTLRFKEHVVGPSGQPAWFYSVDDEQLPSELMVHEATAPLRTDAPVYRVRAYTDIPDEPSKALLHLADEVNRFTTIGLMHMSKTSVEWASQALLDSEDLHVRCALLATGLTHGARSVLGTLSSALNDPAGESRQTVPSSWAGAPIDALAYDRLHMGMCHRVNGGMELRGLYGMVQVLPETRNPYFGGGLLLLSHVAAATLQRECGIVPSATELNRVDVLASNTPLFGGWCFSEEQERFTYVSFLPNLLRDVADLDSQMVDWAQDRTTAVLDTCRWIAELDEDGTG